MIEINTKKSGLEISQKSGAGLMSLYMGVFFQIFFIGMWFVSMPYILKRLGASDVHVGLCLGLNPAVYVTTLFFGRRLLHSFDARRTLKCGSGAISILTMACFLTFIATKNGYSSTRAILIFTVLSAIQGFLTSMFWPQIVGLLSANHEGKQLNRRLGFFNIYMSAGGILGPLLGGYLVENSSVLPLFVCFLSAMLCFAAVSLTAKPSSRVNIADNIRGDYIQEMSLHQRFRWISRIALLTGFFCVGLAKIQLALLFKFERGFSESDFGTAMMIMGVTMLAVITAAAKTHRWHYNLSIFLGSQITILLSLLLILNGVRLWVFLLATGLLGVSHGFLYSSHLYYVISKSQNRSSKMAVHEITLNIGFASGAVIGGFLGGHFGRYMPYWFGFVVVFAGLLAQAAVLLLHNSSQNKELLV